jgi:23S rRNA (adenine2503-C2)-methyltransferase
MYVTDPGDLGALFPDEPRYRTDQLTEWLYAHPVMSADDMTNLPKPMRDQIAQRHWPFSLDVEQSADDGLTKKWLFRCTDSSPIETVLMGYPTRTTLCISSQVGCAMGCTFCATGQFGFDRHLDAGEIVAQVAYANAYLARTPLPRSPERVTNVVFMGMGEPLANYKNTIESIRRMTRLMGISARSITVSTVGFIPGMRQLTKDPLPLNLAVSLHSTIPSERTKLVPINDRYPIDDVVAAAKEYYDRKGRRISLEWTLISGENDSDEEAIGLARIAREIHAHVNVIALNPTPLSQDRPPSRDHIRRFIGRLRREGANVTLRDTRGQDIDAACGQLRLRESDTRHTTHS